MKKTILTLLLVAMSTGAMAEWVELGENDQGVYYIDPTTIRKDGNFRRVWTMDDLKQRGKSGEMSTRTLEEYDCKEELYRTLVISAHDKPMLSGSTLLSVNITTEWRFVPPDTPAEARRSIACGKN